MPPFFFKLWVRLKKKKGTGFPLAQLIKNLPAIWGGLGSIPGLGRSPAEGKGFLLQCSGLENSMDCILHGVAKSRTGLSDFHLGAVGPRCSK